MSVAGVLPLHDVQGNLLHGYGFEHAGFVGVHADTAEALRQCLADLVDRVTSGVHWRGAEPPSTLNAALSFAGLVRLGLPAALLDRFPDAFQEGAARRARSLGDLGRERIPTAGKPGCRRRPRTSCSPSTPGPGTAGTPSSPRCSAVSGPG